MTEKEEALSYLLEELDDLDVHITSEDGWPALHVYADGEMVWGIVSDELAATLISIGTLKRELKRLQNGD